MAPTTHIATIDESRLAAPHTKIIRLHFDGIKDFHFLAGQFVMVWIDGVTDEKGIPLKRAYSIASSPHDHDHLELCVKSEKPGGFAERLNALGKGKTIHIQGPYGKFVLDENMQDDLIFLCGGTGITPILSMTRTMVRAKRPNTMLLFYSNKHANRELYANELDSLGSSCKNLQIIRHMTAIEDDAWSGEVGRIDKERLVKYAGDLSRYKIFMCGPVEMVHGLKEMLLELGADPSKIHQEAWG